MKNERIRTGNVKVGDKFYTSWGYDQTNYDFLVVVAISPTGKTATCRMCKATVENKDSDNRFIDELKPSEPFGDMFRMVINAWVEKGRITRDELRGQYPFCDDGSMENKRVGTFWKVEEGKTYEQTAFGYGH